QDLHSGKLDKCVVENAEKSDNFNMKNENIISNGTVNNGKFAVTGKDIKEISRSYDKKAKTSDNKNILLSCDMCTFTSSREDIVFQHIQRHTQIEERKELLRCNICEYLTTRKHHMLRHMKKHSKKQQKVYMCELCEVEFTEKKAFESHKYDTHIKPGESFDCGLCNNCFDTSQELKRHIKIHSVEKIRFACVICDSTFASQTSLNIHKRTHIGKKSFHCSKCKYSCTKKSTLDNHLLNHTDNDQLLACKECDLKFKNNILLSVHMKIHRMKKPFMCPDCDFRSLSQKDLQEHMKNHKLDKYLICIKCNATFAEKNLFEIHAKTHDTHTDFNCSKCNEFFLSTELLSYHMDVLHCDDDKNTETSTLHLQYGNQNLYNCNVCEFKASSETDFQNHNLIHSNTDNKNYSKLKLEYHNEHLDFKDKLSRNGNTDSSNGKIMKDSSTPYKRKRKSSWTGKGDSSQKLTDEIFICTKCNFQTVDVNLFTIHKSNHVEDDSFKSVLFTSESKNVPENCKFIASIDKCTPLKCSVCDYEAVNDDSLALHNHIHAIEQSFSCSDCNFKAIDQRSLILHQLNHNKKSFLCEICGMTAINSDALNTHNLTHRNENPFHCEVCGFGASHRTALIQHMVALHGGKKIFSCNICTENFTLKSSLKEHLMTHIYGKKRKRNMKTEKKNSKSFTANLKTRKIITNEIQKSSTASDAVNDSQKSSLDKKQDIK
ncbi:unnamed protein product, partial [Meganyctiphanes norvegica]